MSLQNLRANLPKCQIPKNESAARPHAREISEIEPKRHSTTLDSKDTLTIRKNSERNLWVSQKLIETLAKQFPPDRIVGYIEELLTATHVTKGGQVIRDNRAFESAVKLLMAYMVGLPIERREQVNINVDGSEEMQRKILDSPALRDALRKKIEAADAAKSKAEGAEQNGGNSQ